MFNLNNIDYNKYYKSLYNEKNIELILRYGKNISTSKFYNYIFGDLIQNEGNPVSDKYNAIVVYSKNDEFKRRMVFKKYKEYKKHLNKDFVITNGILYAGKKNKSEYARYMCAMIIDLDGVDSMDMLQGLLHRFEMKQIYENSINHITKPTFLVNSGTGFHLYYVFEEPIPLYPEIFKRLTELKRQLTRHLWTQGVTSKYKENEKQYQPITQSFRVVGSQTKLGKDYKVIAFQLNGKFKYDYWNEWLKGQATAYNNNKLKPIILNYETNLKLEEAKEKYPEWYEKRIVNQEEKGHYIVNRALYDWYKRELLDKQESVEGKRYYRVMCLAIYAKKCGITREELEEDALSFLDKLNSFEHKHEFTKKDLYDALELYNDNYYTFPRDTISNLTGFKMKVNKRNYRKQPEHIKYMNIIRDFKYSEIDKNWREGNGRKSKKEEVEKLIKDNPELNVSQLARKSGISRTTIIKYFLKKDK